MLPALRKARQAGTRQPTLTVVRGGQATSLAIQVSSLALSFKPQQRPVTVTTSYVATRGRDRVLRRAVFDFDGDRALVVPGTMVVDGRRVSDPALEALFAEELVALMSQEV